MKKGRIPIVLIITSLMAGCSDTNWEPTPVVTVPKSSTFFFPVETIDDDAISVGQLIYVPVYSRVHLSGLGVRELAVLLSIRNTDLEHPIIVRLVQYYDTDGTMLEDYLSESYQLAPLATADFVIDQADTRGGTGANFLVEWVAEQSSVNVPIVEAVMAGISGSQGLSFIRNGQVIDQIHGSP